MVNAKHIFHFLFLLLIFVSCGKKKDQTAGSVENTSTLIESAESVKDKPVEAVKEKKFQIERFDRDLFALDRNNIDLAIDSLNQKYAPFLQLYSNYVVKMGDPGTPEFKANLELFFTDTTMIQLYDSIQLKFPNLKRQEKQLSQGFASFAKAFPGHQIPRIIASINGFNQSIVIGDGVIGVGLDKYLGADFTFYRYLGIYSYLLPHMVPERISCDVMHSFAISEFSFNDSIDNLLSNMIYEGRALYFTKQMMPDLPDSLIAGYSKNQLKWCKSNEAAMWTYLAEHKLLFNIERLTIRKFIGEAPFTMAFSNESPGQACVWIGWQIVDSFMKKNKDVDLKRLMEITDYQYILSNSGYMPH